MWILPRLSSAPAESQPLHRSQFPFTNHRITLAVYPGTERKPKSSQRWFRVRDLALIPLPSPHRRALADILASS
jgi:hypothetical protein